MATTLALQADASIRKGDAVCTEGAFDLQEEKYSEVLAKCAPVGLRALRDRRLIALSQSASAAAASSGPSSIAIAFAESWAASPGGGSSSKKNAATAAAATTEADSVPVSTNMLRFQSGPSQGKFLKKAPSKVPSKNREELERIAKLIRMDGGGDDDDDDHPHDDAALLRSAMAEAKKRAKLLAQQQQQQQESIRQMQLQQQQQQQQQQYGSGQAHQHQNQSKHQLEREKQFVDLVHDSMPTLLGSTSVRLFGMVLSVAPTHATVQVWRRGSTIYTDRRPLERIPLSRLQKLSPREFNLCCTQPLVSYTYDKTRKAESGAVSVEDMPATLMAHTNEIVESLIQKMEATATIQQQAVADEIAAAKEAAQHQHHHHPHHHGHHTPPPTKAAAAATAALLSASRGGSITPTSGTRAAAGGGGGRRTAGADLGSVLGFKLSDGRDRHKMFRGLSLKNRHNAQQRQTLAADSPLLRKYHEGTKCGVAVLRSLPEPPVTRLIDPLVDVRDEFRALAVMNVAGGRGSFTPTSEYIRSLQQQNAGGGGGGGGSSSSSKAAAAAQDDSAITLPVLGTVRAAQGGAAGSAAASQQASLTGAESSLKIPPPAPTYIECSLRDIRPPSALTMSPTAGAGGRPGSRGLLTTPTPDIGGSGSGSGSGTSPHTAGAQQQQQPGRVVQPVPPALLYSSYPADAQKLPPEIPCTVLEYRVATKTMLLSVRRIATAPSSQQQQGGAGGRPSSSSSPASTGRSATRVPSSAGSGASSTSAGRVSEDSDAAASKWQAALAGLSTIVVKCAFVDIIGEQTGEADHFDEGTDDAALAAALAAGKKKKKKKKNLDDDDYDDDEEDDFFSEDRSSSPGSRSPSHSPDASPGGAARPGSSASHRSAQQQQYLLKSPTNSSFGMQHRPSQQLPHAHALLDGKSGTSGSAGQPAILSPTNGDEYLASLVGKQVDVIALWSTFIGGEAACVADVQRGDLSILDDMVTSQFAAVSAGAKSEYDAIRGVFGPQQQQQRSSQQQQQQQQQQQHGGAGGGGVAAALARSLSDGSPTSGSPSDFDASGSGANFGQPQPMHAAKSMNMATLSRMKSGYFGASAAQEALERDPNLVINAAESFLGRRVFRLFEALEQQNRQLMLRREASAGSILSSPPDSPTIVPLGRGAARHQQQRVASSSSDTFIGGGGGGLSPPVIPQRQGTAAPGFIDLASGEADTMAESFLSEGAASSVGGANAAADGDRKSSSARVPRELSQTQMRCAAAVEMAMELEPAQD